MTRFHVLHGDDYTIIVQVNNDGVPRDLSSVKQVYYHVCKRNPQGEMEEFYHDNLQGNVNIPSPSDGKIYIEFPSSLTEEIKSGQILHGCAMIDESDRHVTLFSEFIDVECVQQSDHDHH